MPTSASNDQELIRLSIIELPKVKKTVISIVDIFLYFELSFVHLRSGLASCGFEVCSTSVAYRGLKWSRIEKVMDDVFGEVFFYH